MFYKELRLASKNVSAIRWRESTNLVIVSYFSNKPTYLETKQAFIRYKVLSKLRAYICLMSSASGRTNWLNLLAASIA